MMNDEYWPRSFCWEEARDAESFSREMLYAFHHEGISLDLLGDLIWSQFQLRHAQDRVRHSQTRIPPRISSVIGEIARHPERPHSVKSLAEKVGLSPSHLHAEFKAATGKTPHQMVIQYRMSAARHRLVTSMDPVKAIAFDVGFSNTENFVVHLRSTPDSPPPPFVKNICFMDKVTQAARPMLQVTTGENVKNVYI